MISEYENEIIALVMYTMSAGAAAASALTFKMTGDNFIGIAGFIISLGVAYGTHKILPIEEKED